MKPIREQVKQKPWLGWVLFLATMVVVFLLGLLASSVMERREEAAFAYKPQVEHSQFEPRNEVWGQNFPQEYNRYRETLDTTFRSKYNGNAFIDMLEEYPELVVLWANYGFSKEYNQGRGHAYAIEDIRKILRTGAPVDGKSSPMPNTCWTCKSPDVPRVMNEIGVAEFYKGSWETLGHEIVNPIGCADCHDADDMSLRITRPALKEAFESQGRDINDVTHQEKRSLVCAQCHVEYYFKGDSNYLVLPWEKGVKIEEVIAYYDSYNFVDWKHGISKAPMLKAQHPDYELFQSGIHAKRGLACADCHMPYMSEGGQKFSDHKVQSPLNYINRTCQVCHREDEKDLVENVYERQDKVKKSRRQLEKLLVRAHVEAGKAWELNATEEEMKDALYDIRHAQMMWDYVAASHGAPFHAPIESSRILAKGINTAQEARLKLSRILMDKGFEGEVSYPDIPTKAKAQEYIGLDMDKLNAEKEKFMKEVVPEWIEKAKKREATYETKDL
ncbi:MAG: ammonia-forming cytochrome c nitrite reductase [Bacteroidota bacterium]